MLSAVPCLNNVQLLGDCHKLARKLQLLRQPAVVDRLLATAVQIPGRVAHLSRTGKELKKWGIIYSSPYVIGFLSVATSRAVLFSAMPEQCPAAWRLPQIGAQASAPPAAGCSGPAPCNAGTGPGPRDAICPALQVLKKINNLFLHIRR